MCFSCSIDHSVSTISPKIALGFYSCKPSLLRLLCEGATFPTPGQVPPPGPSTVQRLTTRSPHHTLVPDRQRSRLPRDSPDHPSLPPSFLKMKCCSCSEKEVFRNYEKPKADIQHIFSDHCPVDKQQHRASSSASSDGNSCMRPLLQSDYVPARWLTPIRLIKLNVQCRMSPRHIH